MKDLKARFDVLADASEEVTKDFKDVAHEVRDFAEDLAKLAGTLETTRAAFAAAPASSGSGTAGAGQSEGGGVGGDLTQLAAQIGSAFAKVGGGMATAFAPVTKTITTVSGSITRMVQILDRFAGTFVTLAQRINASMKNTRDIDYFTAKLKKAEDQGKSNWYAKVRLDMLGYQRDWSKMGNVAGQTLSQIENKTGILGKIAGVMAHLFPAQTFGLAVKLGAAIGSLAAPAARAVKGFLGLTNSALKLVGINPGRLITLFVNPFSLLKKKADGAAQSVGRVTTQLHRSASAVRSFGADALMALGVFGLAYKVVEFFKNGIKGASDLNESVNVTKETFGSMAGEITTQVDGLSGAFGFNKKALLDAANGYGALAQGAKLTDRQATDLTKTFTQLTADLVSYKNLKPEEAAQVLTSALRGQMEPLSGVGVLINENLIKQEALRQGLFRGKGALSEYAKMTAIAALATRGLGKASGDLVRTSDSAANQFRKAGGGLENFGTTIGQLLLPAVQSGAEAFNELLASVVQLVENNRPMLEGWGKAIAGVMDGVGVAVRNAGTIWKIAELQVGAFVENAGRWLATFPANLAIIGEYLGNNWVKLIKDAFSAALSVLRNFQKNLVDLGVAVIQFMKDPTKGFQFKFTPLLDGFKATAEKLPELIKPSLVNVEDQINALKESMVGNEMARIAAAKATAVKAADAAATGPVAGEYKAAGALELGSKEAYSAIVKDSAGGDPSKKIAKNSDKQVQLLEKILESNRAKTAAAAPAVVAIGA